MAGIDKNTILMLHGNEFSDASDYHRTVNNFSVEIDSGDTKPYSSLDAPFLFIPPSIIVGGLFVVSWLQVETATSYTLEQQVDNGEWSQVYTGAGTNYQATAVGSTMAFRVLATDAEGSKSEYTTSDSVKVFPDLSGKLFGGMIVNG